MEYVLLNKNICGYVIWSTNNTIYKDCNINNYLVFDKRFNDYIREFDYIMKDSVSDNCRALFNKNIKDLKIICKRSNLSDKLNKIINNFPDSSCRYYDTNVIELKNIRNESVLKNSFMHELLHMSSSKMKGLSGFHQTYISPDGKVRTIGKMINEGYTDLLNQDYFSNNLSTGYFDEMKVARSIENVIGKDKMQEFYFNADLAGLINEIAIYSSEDMALDIIVRLDLAADNIKNRDKYLSDVNNDLKKLKKNNHVKRKV